MTLRENNAIKPFAHVLSRFLPRFAPDSDTEHERRHTVYAKITAENEGNLLRLARRLCVGNEEHAQDLVQDTLIRGYEAYLGGKFEEGTNAGGWLRRILTNLFLEECRKQKRVSDLDLDTVVAEGKFLPDSLHALRRDRPDTALLTEILDEDLERALALLVPALRLSVILVDMEQLSYAEAAQSMSIPIGTVRSRLFRAHEQLAAILETYAEQRRLS